MSDPARYAEWTAVSHAIREAARKRAGTDGGPDLNTQITSARFDRFLSRVFADGEESEWLLKGGTSILARVPRSRTTKDVDLAAAGGSLDDAVDALRGYAQRDLGDHLTFELTRTTVTGQGDNQPGVETRRLVFTCRDRSTGRRVGDVPVDVVVGGAPTGEVEVVEPANRLALPRPLVTFPYRLFPLVDQVADKVCATMATNYPNGRPSSRVKDLVDMVVIARTQRLDLDQLRVAIETKRALSGIQAFAAFSIPQEWSTRYRDLAKRTPAAGGISNARDAERLVAQLINPALLPAGGPARIWVPGAGWVDAAAAAAASAELSLDADGNETVYVRQHIRAGSLVQEHWRGSRSDQAR